MKAFLIPGVAALALAGCSTADLDTASKIAAIGAASIQAACDDASTVAAKVQVQVKGGALNTANSIISNYLAPACSSALSVAKLATDPSSQAWIGTINGQLSAILNPPKA